MCLCVCVCVCVCLLCWCVLSAVFKFLSESQMISTHQTGELVQIFQFLFCLVASWKFTCCFCDHFVPVKIQTISFFHFGLNSGGSCASGG